MRNRRLNAPALVLTVAVASVALCTATHAQSGATDDPWTLLQAELATTPAHATELAHVLSLAGEDPHDLHAWVHHHTDLVPYRGALRGARGVLLDRAGNALDRALLLHALLEAAGHDVALAHAELDDAQLAIVASGVDAAPHATEPLDDDEIAALAERARRELGLDAAAVHRTLVDAADAQRRLQSTLSERTDASSATLLQALEDVLRASAQDPDGEALRDHWWVVLRGADGSQLDLDPSLPGAGARLVAAEALHTVTGPRDLATLDGDCPDLRCGERLHLVLVRAVAEVHADGVAEEHTLLEHTLVAAELDGLAVALSVVAFGGDGVPDPFAITDPTAALRAALLEHDRWRPMITIGGDELADRVVSAGGHLLDDPDQRPATSGGGPLGGLGAIGGRQSAAPAARGIVTALWWEFEIVTPGHPTALERRAVVDLHGPERRAAGEQPGELSEHARLERALALSGQSELLVSGAALTEESLARRAAQRLLAEREAFEAWAGPLDAPMSETNERLVATMALVSPLERFSLERGLATRRAGDGAQLAVSVLAYHQRMTAELALEAAFDVISAPAGAAAPAGPVTARLRGGVLDAVLEGLLAIEPDEVVTQAVPSVADAFARDPGSWLAAAPGEALPTATSLGGDLAARARADLAAGFAVVVPTGADDAVGHWRVDPNTGSTLAIGTLGWGQAMASYAERVATMIEVHGTLKRYANLGRCLGLAVSQPLQGVQGVGEELAECVFDVVCSGVESVIGKLTGGAPSWTSIGVGFGVGKAWGGVCSGLWGEISR